MISNTVVNVLYYRIEGRVQRFTFVRDDEFNLDERQEKELMVLGEDNKVTITSVLSIQTGTLGDSDNTHLP